MRKPKYRDADFQESFKAFELERKRLIETLRALDEDAWLRHDTFTGTSARQRDQTVLRYAGRIVHHEQPHLEQIEELLA